MSAADLNDWSERAARLLLANKVPPIQCGNCGACFYVEVGVLAAGQDVRTLEDSAGVLPIAVECECGSEWLIG